MVGSVLHQEMLLGGRRSRLYILRWIYAALLLLELLGIFIGICWHIATNPRSANADPTQNFNAHPWASILGSTFAEFFVWQQWVLLLLITPAFVAGAITDEKRRGTLQYLLTADLDTRHVVLGKLIGRVAQVGLIMLSGFPLFFVMAGFGGVEPATLVIATLTLLAPLFALCAGAMLASVLCRQTYEAILLLYLIVWVVAPLLHYGPLQYLHPLNVLQHAWAPFTDIDWPDLLVRLGIEILAWVVIGGVCLALAVRYLRRVYIRELETSPTDKSRFLAFQRPPVGDDPIRWREVHVESPVPRVFVAILLFVVPLWIVPFLIVYLVARLTGRPLRRLSLLPSIVLVAVLTTLSSGFLLWLCLPAGATFTGFTQALTHFDVRRLQAMMPDPNKTPDWFWLQGLIVMLLFSLWVGILCSATVTGEREKQTWEAALLTPLSARQLVRSKLWGVLASMRWFLLAYAVPALLLSVAGGLGALAWTVVWLAVTAVAIYFIGAVGVWCSVRFRSSWVSLMITMLLGYLGGLLLYLLVTPAILILALLFILLLFIIDSVLQTGWGLVAASSWPAWWPVWKVASCICLAAAFFLAARTLLGWAQRWIADRERTRHWHEEPIYRRARRPLPAAPPMYGPRY
jgi:ABC-type transport system involved in multi-copper enzyme maturation permease subunit